MSNKIPIDDLFRDKLSGGKEQLNLGAWANMERMLNGQNPYSGDEQEPKRKRRILPFLLVFVLFSSAISAGYLLLNKKDNIAHDLSQPNTKSVKNNENKAELTAANNLDKSNTPNQINPNPEKKTTQIAKQPDFAKKSKKNSKFSSEKANIANDHLAKNNANVAATDAVKSANASSNNESANQKGKKKSADKNDNADIVYNGKSEIKDVAMNVPGNEKGNTLVRKGTKTVSNEKVKTGRNGKVESITYDTVSQSPFEIVKANQTTEVAAAADNTPGDENYKYHPRYVGADVNADEPQIVLNSKPENAVKTPTLSTAADGKEKKKSKEEKTGVFNAIGAFTSLALTKIGESGGNFFRMFTVLDPGVSLGVNAALFNTKNNYGGFHAGLTNHTAISETFSIMTELKFFLRNNSGFTINDIRTKILKGPIDTFSSPGNTIYSYQVDSTTKRYNFKSFMSFELPVLLNARFNNLSVYGGPNFVYNMKFKINEIDRNFTDPNGVKVTVPNGTPFNYPVEKSMQYTRTDFGSRFGIGYAVGVSYNFNPKIYLDLRLSKVVWDNTKTNTQREISNGVTKVPFTQLSLGYKFKNK